MTSPLRILILDDAVADAELVELELRRGGIEFEASVAVDKSEYVRALEEGAPGLILADYQLPDMDGIEALSLADTYRPGVPVIFVTGVLGDEIAVETLKMGASDYVLKDRLKRLVPAVRRVLREVAEADERRMLTDDLIAREARFRSLVQSSFEAIVVADAGGIIQYASPSFGAILGYSPDEVQGRAGLELTHRDAEESASLFLERALSSTEPTGPATFFVRHRNGALRRVEVVATNRLTDPSVRGLVINARDVTERETAAEFLASRDRILEAVALTAKRLLEAKWTDCIEEVLARLGRASKVSRAELYRLNAGEGGSLVAGLVGGWSAAGVPCVERIDDPEGLLLIERGHPQWVQPLLEGRAIHGLVRELPDRERPLLESQSVIAFSAVPITVRHGLWGFFAFHDCVAERRWSIAELDAVSAAADIFGAALEREHIQNDLQESQRRKAEAFTLLESIQLTAPVGLAFVDRDLRVVHVNEMLAAVNGVSPEKLIGRTVADAVPHFWPQIEGIYRTVLKTNEPIINVELTGETAEEPGRLRSWLASYYPVRLNGELLGIGIVVVDITQRREAEQEHDDLMRAAAAAIAAAVEARDPYTAGHQQRVGLIAGAIAVELGLEQQIIDGITLAAEIHDIGKIGVPAEILARPGRLHPAEFELIKGHPRAGFDIVGGIKFPWPIADMIHQHHEAFDGSGYPRGLSGDGILLGARIIHVADVLEAMSSHRPYRASRGIDETLDEIEKGKGTQFDPVAADACLRLCRGGQLNLTGWSSLSA